MNATDDWQLLRDYAQQNSEEAFRVLVERYAGLVYHTALRQSGNPQTAQDVTQAVFIALASKADRLPRGTILPGWLFRATRFAFANIAREEFRRQRREQEAVKMNDMLQPDDNESAWKNITPLLDDALDGLSTKDREAILIRFFQDKSHRETAQLLGISEDAAKARVSRAVEKLRLIFAARGVAVSSALLLAVFTTHGAQAAPAGLTAVIASAAVAKGTAGTASAVTIAKGVLKIMAWTKMKSAIVAGVVVLAGGVATTVIIQQHESKRAGIQNKFFQNEWTFAGYADPRAALMSYLYVSARQTDRKTFEGSLTGEQLRLYQRMVSTAAKGPPSRSEDEVVADIFKRASEQWRGSSYQILDEYPIVGYPDAAKELLYRLLVHNSKQDKEVFIKIKKVGDEWKFDGFKQ